MVSSLLHQHAREDYLCKDKSFSARASNGIMKFATFLQPTLATDGATPTFRHRSCVPRSIPFRAAQRSMLFFTDLPTHPHSYARVALQSRVCKMLVGS
uniref:Uncharacterized protein n=1 Tax=Rhipicephalus zambeziensis TaxID=60191 RepID=A0A224Y7N6_9ACAR